MTPGIFIDHAIATASEWLENQRNIVHLAPANQLHEPADNSTALGRLEIVPDNVSDSDMRFKNVWDVFDDRDHDHYYSGYLENEQNATVTMQNLASTSSIGDGIKDKRESKISEQWSIDFESETAAWMDTIISAREELSSQEETGQSVTDI